MPRFNTLGDYEAGIGGGTVEAPVTLIVNGAVCNVGPGGGGDWLTTQEVACYRYIGSLRAVAIDKTTGAERLLRETALGFNQVVAGGGRWATTETQSGVVMLDDGTVSPYPIMTIGTDGAIATRAHAYNNSGLIVAGTVLQPAASDEDVMRWGTNAWDVQVLDAGHVVWRSWDGPHAVGLPVPQLLPGESYGLRVANLQGVWWVCYLAAGYNGSLVCHPVNSFLGCQLTAPAAAANRPDLVAVGSRLRVVYALDLAEQTNVVVEPGVTSPIIDLTTTAPTPPEPIPPDPGPDPGPPPAVTITAYAATGPLEATATGAVTQGSVVSLTWLYRPQGATDWAAATTPPDQLTYIYHFAEAGDYELKLSGTDAIGRTAETGQQRIVHVTSGDEPAPEPPEGGAMAVYLKCGHFYTGVDPTPVLGMDADAQFPVYADREQGGVWEEVTLTPHDDGGFDVLYVAANRTLSIQPDGTLETREAGTYGGYEAVYATTQPDGASILYRRDEDVVIPCNILTIEDRS